MFRDQDVRPLEWVLGVTESDIDWEVCCAMSGTDLAYGTTQPYAMSGTDLSYGTTHFHAMANTELACGTTTPLRESRPRYHPTRSLCAVRYWPSVWYPPTCNAIQYPVLTGRMALPGCYAKCGTDVAHIFGTRQRNHHPLPGCGCPECVPP
eukprot:3327593-Rhodomonas_salina.1